MVSTRACSLCIWESQINVPERNLIDTEQRGSLNNIEFAVGMYLIQAIKTCQLTALPTSIPQHVHDQFAVKSNSPFAALASRVPPKSAPLPWKSPSLPVKNAIAQSNNDPWEVSVVEQAEANGHFDTLDADKTGMIDGDESARFMLKFFRLPPGDIATIWFVHSTSLSPFRGLIQRLGTSLTYDAITS